jgi:hypothetical protein
MSGDQWTEWAERHAKIELGDYSKVTVTTYPEFKSASIKILIESESGSEVTLKLSPEDVARIAELLAKTARDRGCLQEPANWSSGNATP